MLRQWLLSEKEPHLPPPAATAGSTAYGHRRSAHWRAAAANLPAVHRQTASSHRYSGGTATIPRSRPMATADALPCADLIAFQNCLKQASNEESKTPFACLCVANGDRFGTLSTAGAGGRRRWPSSTRSRRTAHGGGASELWMTRRRGTRNRRRPGWKLEVACGRVEGQPVTS